MDTILASNTLRLVRVFDAPRDRVFEAWTEARQFMAWMCPPGCGLDVCELDVRPGGAWRAKGFKPSGERFAKSGVYLDVKRPELLSFTWAHHQDGDWTSLRGHETTVRIELRALGNKTELALTQGPFIDMPDFRGHGEGWKACFDKLVDYLGGSA